MKNLPALTLDDQIRAGTPPLILDVRTRREFVEGHIPGAIHIPFWRVPAKSFMLAEFIDKPVVVYCGHGPRAYLAGAALRRRGFRRVAYLAGHMKVWRTMKLPVEVG